MADIEFIQKAWKFVQDNDGAITILVLPVLGGLGGGIWWIGKKGWKRIRRKRLRVVDIDTFPFEVIPPHRCEDVVQKIYGSAQQTKDDPLADFNIPYQRRLSDRDVQQELMERVRASWLIVLGPTGLGKTREVAELAKTHSQEGWTVLRLNNYDLLTVPDEFPVDRLDRQPKLLFVLDNLNQAMYLGQRLPMVDAEGKEAEPVKSPLQSRLLETLDFYINVCPGQVRVVATARNEREAQQGEEMSPWERLGIEKYPDFWRRFEQYELLPPEDRAMANVLVEAADRASVEIAQTDLAQIVRTNDRTFRNLVTNLEGAKNRKEVLTAKTFNPTMKGTWEERYRNAQKQYGASASLIYNAIDLLRQTEVVLHPLTVIAATRLLSKAGRWRWIWQQRQIGTALTELIQSERILEPRDGQIEAKGSVVEAGSYLSLLAQSLPSQLPPQAFSVSLWGLAFAAYKWKQYKLIID
ncbi:MAG: hypothetical protein WA947_16105, partial [Phormidesmis sp.]